MTQKSVWPCRLQPQKGDILDLTSTPVTIQGAKLVLAEGAGVVGMLEPSELYVQIFLQTTLEHNSALHSSCAGLKMKV